MSAVPPSGAAARRAWLGRRGVDQLSVLLLVASAAVVAAVASPAVLRALEPGPPLGARTGVAAAMRGRGYATGVKEPAHVPRSSPDAMGLGAPAGALGSPAAELERGTRAALEDDEREGIDAPAADEVASWGFTAVETVLRARPEASAPVVSTIGRGQMVVVARQQGGWLLVGHRGDEGLQLGWVPATGVLLGRPGAD